MSLKGAPCPESGCVAAIVSTYPAMECGAGHHPDPAAVALAASVVLADATAPTRPARNGRRNGHAKRSDAPTFSADDRLPEIVVNDEVSRPGQRPSTDLGNAERLVDLHGERLRYSQELGTWLEYDGRRWSTDRTGRAVSRAKEMVRSIYREAAEAPTSEERGALASHARRSEAGARIEAALKLAQSALPITVAELDRDQWLLNVTNGTVDLLTGELRPHRREDYITKLIDLPYDPGARCERWERFLAEVQPAEDVRAFLHRAAGYSATGSARERIVIIGYGVGRNGKGTFLQTLREILGEYAVRTPSETLLARRGESIPNDVAQLRGARFVFASETGDGRRLDEARVKDLTGGEDIPARFMRGEWFSFPPTFTLWLATNHKPVVRGTDAAIWDRLRLVPFGVRFRLADELDDGSPVADPTLAEQLASERAGILAWIVRGAVLWHRDGLGTAGSIREAVASYRDQMDVLGAFLDDQCIVDRQASVGSTEIYQAYKTWAQASGETAVSQRVVSIQLEERGFRKGKGRTGMVFFGLRLREPNEPYQTTFGEGCEGSDPNFPIGVDFLSHEAPIPEKGSHPSHPSHSTPWRCSVCGSLERTPAQPSECQTWRCDGCGAMPQACRVRPCRHPAFALGECACHVSRGT